MLKYLSDYIFTIYVAMAVVVILTCVGIVIHNQNQIAIQEDVNITVIEEVKVNPTVIMITRLNPKVDKDVALVIANSIEKYTEKYNLSIPLVIALMYRESGFRPIIISKANCIGLMQINPKAHPEKVKPYKRYQLFHIDVNVSIGCQILSQYLIKRKGNVKKALQNYLGANNTGYLIDVLSTCVELGINK